MAWSAAWEGEDEEGFSNDGGRAWMGGWRRRRRKRAGQGRRWKRVVVIVAILDSDDGSSGGELEREEVLHTTLGLDPGGGWCAGVVFRVIAVRLGGRGRKTAITESGLALAGIAGVGLGSAAATEALARGQLRG